ncbi:hypothetical protein PoB_001081200 [Plakobranchus ocellatus]|uniref:Uncharacterized protein n=1 Tax=Plakobranchus ocellatus TaxID=259542 RepID=A0AAV3YQ94_9GAST|nr:hypothetical protein PoB_001081200 [Plakobranchus ocellatus]
MVKIACVAWPHLGCHHSLPDTGLLLRPVFSLARRSVLSRCPKRRYGGLDHASFNVDNNFKGYSDGDDDDGKADDGNSLLYYHNGLTHLVINKAVVDGALTIGQQFTLPYSGVNTRMRVFTMNMILDDIVYVLIPVFEQNDSFCRRVSFLTQSFVKKLIAPSRCLRTLPPSPSPRVISMPQFSPIFSLGAREVSGKNIPASFQTDFLFPPANLLTRDASPESASAVVSRQDSNPAPTKRVAIRLSFAFVSIYEELRKNCGKEIGKTKASEINLGLGTTTAC